MFIKFKERYFNIVSIINVREKNEMLEIICTERITENKQKTMEQWEKQVFGNENKKITFNVNEREV